MASRTRPKRRRFWQSRPGRWTLGLAAAVALAAALFVWKLNRDVSEFLAGRQGGALEIYSTPYRLRPGIDVERAGLRARLTRLGYREHGALDTGSFRAGRDRIEIGLRPFYDPFGEQPPAAVRLERVDGIGESIRSLPDGRLVSEAWIEPELLGSYAGGVLGERRPVPLDELPRHVISALLAAEDARFAAHPGIDPLSLLRAALVNLRGGRVRQGGSTITQQLAKNVFLTPRRSLARKLTEAILALLLEARLTKDEILESYLNTIYLGRVGAIGIYGIAPAARAFFGKDPRELTVGEAATIAGVVRAPNLDSPIRHPERARARRNLVLAAMHENGWLGRPDLERLRAAPLGRARRAVQPLQAPFFVDEVLRRLGRLGYSPLLVRGVAVYTTVDLEAQRLAESALATSLDALGKRYRRLGRAKQPLEGSLVLLEPETGFVRALIGGRDFARSQFNRATRSLRQPGSAFKPFVYLAALDDRSRGITAASRLQDEPLRLRVGRGVWTPANYDGRYLGEVSVRQALEDSRNVPTVRLAGHVGYGRVAEMARLVGLGDVDRVPAMALGASEVTLLDLVAAYTVFPNLGEVTRPALIRGVVDTQGNVLYRDRESRRRVATSPAAYVTSHLLEGVVDHGTANAVRRLGIREPVAGKTGTTNDTKDAWFVGYSASLVAGVWVGFDDGTPIGLSGAAAALPAWGSIMRGMLAIYGARDFAVPPGVVFRDVDRETGLLASWLCPDSIREAFVLGTEPMFTCDGREIEPSPGRVARVFGDLDPGKRGEEPGANPWKRAERWLEGVFGGR